MARSRLGRTVCYRRLAALVDHGLLSWQRLVYGQPALYTATRDLVAWGDTQTRTGPGRRRETPLCATCAPLAVRLRAPSGSTHGASRGCTLPSSRPDRRSRARSSGSCPTAAATAP